MENKWAFFNLSELKPTIIVRRFDDNKGNRFYYFLEGEEVIVAAGETSCFNAVLIGRKTIDDWKEKNPNWRHLLKISSEYGTLEHEVFGDIALNKGVNQTKLQAMQAIAYENGQNFNMPAKDVLAFLKLCEDIQLTPLIIEGMLVWKDGDEYLAMTIDMLAKVQVKEKSKITIEEGVYQRGENKGMPKIVEKTVENIKEKIILIDFKSNFFEKKTKTFFEGHRMQLIAAKKAVEQIFDIKVDDVYNFSPNNWEKEPSYTLYKHNLTEKDYQSFDAYWNLIKAKGINKPSGNIFKAEEFRNSSDYEFISYKDYAEKLLKNI